MRAMPMAVTVSRYVMRNVFVYWSNMFTGIVSRTISGCRTRRIVLS